jgi:hypothetical protein
MKIRQMLRSRYLVHILLASPIYQLIPAFVAHITRALSRGQIEEQIRHIESRGSQRPTTKMISKSKSLFLSLSNFVAVRSADPRNPDLLKLLPELNETINSDTLVDIDIERTKKEFRFHDMVCHSTLFSWLYYDCFNHSIAALKKEDGVNLWMEQISNSVYAHFYGPGLRNTRTKRKIYPSNDFLPHKLKDKQNVDVVSDVPKRLWKGASHDDRDTRYRNVAREVVRILFHWCSPSNCSGSNSFDGIILPAWALKGRFVHSLVTAYGNNDILLLDGIWDIFQEVKSKAFGDPKKKTFTSSFWGAFSRSLGDLPLIMHESPEYQLLQRLAALSSRNTRPLVTAPVAGLSPTNISSAGLGKSPHSLSPPRSAMSHPTASTQHHSRTSLDAITPNPERDARAIRLIISFLYMGRKVSNPDTPLDKVDMSLVSPAKLDWLVRLLESQPDRFLPQREYATCRKRLMSTGGPFDPKHIRKAFGMFSAIVARAYTFGNLAFITAAPSYLKSLGSIYIEYSNHPNVFKTLQQFEAVRDQWPHGPLDITDIYSTPSPQRTYSANHKSWWEFAERWEMEFRKSSDVLSWARAHSLISKPKNIPGVGALMGYLLLVDLAYSGAVQWPTADEVAVEVARGANKGLQLLGFSESCDGIPVSPSKQFKYLLTLLDHSLSSTEKDELEWTDEQSPILLEHTLCKMCRDMNKSNEAPHMVLFPGKGEEERKRSKLGKKKGKSRKRQKAKVRSNGECD